LEYETDSPLSILRNDGNSLQVIQTNLVYLELPLEKIFRGSLLYIYGYFRWKFTSRVWLFLLLLKRVNVIAPVVTEQFEERKGKI
jgi:hypothetical protein